VNTTSRDLQIVWIGIKNRCIKTWPDTLAKSCPTAQQSRKMAQKRGAGQLLDTLRCMTTVVFNIFITWSKCTKLW